MKRILLLSFCIASIYAQAQDEFDALRYGFTTYQGTARGMGIGGATGSIGADFTGLSVNPATIGIYRSSEISFSPSFTTNSSEATFQGRTSTANDNKFNLSHIGLVSTRVKRGNDYKRSIWKTFSLGIGMNRQATFRNQYTYTGNNSTSSLIEKYAEEMNSKGGINSVLSESLSYPAFAAYQTYLIDRDPSDTLKAKSFVPYSGGLEQSKRVEQRGGAQEYVLSVGANCMERLMLGATVGLTRYNYTRTLTYSEDDMSGNANNDFLYFDLVESLITEGMGINLKLGAIYKPSSAVRFGLAFHTPTHIEFDDTYSMQMQSHTENLLSKPITTYSSDSVQVFNYTQTTPYKALASMSVLFNTNGFITADVEYMDYSTMRYNYRGFDALGAAMNNAIRNTYKSAINLRIGAEAKLRDFSIRGGFAHYGSPFKNSVFAGSRNIISAGVGYRTLTWFLDATYAHTIQKTAELPYTLARNVSIPVASIANNTGQFLMTLGLRF